MMYVYVYTCYSYSFICKATSHEPRRFSYVAPGTPDALKFCISRALPRIRFGGKHLSSGVWPPGWSLKPLTQMIRIQPNKPSPKKRFMKLNIPLAMEWCIYIIIHICHFDPRLWLVNGIIFLSGMQWDTVDPSWPNLSDLQDLTNCPNRWHVLFIQPPQGPIHSDPPNHQIIIYW